MKRVNPAPFSGVKKWCWINKIRVIPAGGNSPGFFPATALMDSHMSEQGSLKKFGDGEKRGNSPAARSRYP